MKLQATYVSNYRSKQGNVVFRYKVTGSKEAMEAYEEAQGEYYRVDEQTGDVYWFTTRFVGNNATLIINDKGRIYADMSDFNKAASLAMQFGGNLGEELAKQAAAKLMGRTSPEATTAPQPTTSGSGLTDL